MDNSIELKNLVLDFEKNHNPSASEYFKFINELNTLVKAIQSDVAPVEYPRNKYPVDQYGFAIAFDPVTHPLEVLSHWTEFGFVVLKNTISIEHIKNAVSFIEDVIRSQNLLTQNCITDSSGTPLLSRGFLDIYHHQTLADLRQSLRLYKIGRAHV
mgnify:CR=1 FL=1